MSDPNDAPVFDPTRLAMLMEMEEDGDDTMIRDIAVQFIEDIKGVLERIEKALPAGDLAQIAGAAHTVKGSAATFGLYRVEKIAKQLEALAKGGKAGEILPVFETLKSEFTAGKTALLAYLEKK